MVSRPQRQLNVRQQNERTETGIRQSATYWRKVGVPEALRAYGSSQGVQWEQSIVIDLEIDFPGMPRLFGTLLTQDEKFIQFEIDTDSSHCAVLLVEKWCDITDRQDMIGHNRGTGIGSGLLAIKVLKELNA